MWQIVYTEKLATYSQLAASPEYIMPHNRTLAALTKSTDV